MSNYCIAEDIQIAYGWDDEFSVDSKPTLTQINNIIADITNEIDCQLAVIGITEQPTDSRILAKLKSGCILGCGARAGFGYINPADSHSDTKPKTYAESYKEFLQGIIDDPDVFLNLNGNETFVCGTDATDSVNTDNDDYLMKKDWKS